MTVCAPQCGSGRKDRSRPWSPSALGWNSGITVPLSRTREEIRQAAQRAIKKAPQAGLLRFKEPVTVSLELSRAEQAKSIAMMPGIRQAGDRQIEFTSSNILEAHKALIAALMIVHSPLVL